MQTNSSIIDTENLQDFPAASLRELGLTAMTTDEVLVAMLAHAELDLIGAIEAWLTRRHRPAYTKAELIDRLQEVGLSDFSKALDQAWG